MRRLFACTVGLILLASCTDTTDPSILDDQQGEEEGLSPTANFEIYDGTSNTDGANPHFFFLPPVVPTSPAYAGVPDEDEEPTVTVCPSISWDDTGEACESDKALVEFFATVPDQYGNVVTVGPGGKYRVRWDTKEYAVEPREEFRVAVSLGSKNLGWVDVKAYNNGNFSQFDPQGNVVLSTTGELNIVFRIEEGALEYEYCDASGVEDCDVEIFRAEESGCLRVFENPGQNGELLGSQACLPANAARFSNGDPVQGEYAVILTLEDASKQGGAVPTNLQVPFFPDLKTDPPGIVFDPNSSGVGVVICQAVEGDGSIPEGLHSQLRPFVVYSNGTTALPQDFSFGAPECEGFGPHAHTASADQPSEGLLGRLAAGVTKASSFFLPKPLRAWRLHGGLNTTVYNTSGDDGGGEEEEAELVSGLEPAGESFVVELGALLDINPDSSNAVGLETGRVGTETTFTIFALNVFKEPFPFEVPVTASVVSGDDVLPVAITYLGSGAYGASYTPTTVGTDLVTVIIDAVEVSESPYSSEIFPRLADAAGTTFGVSYSEVGDPTTVTVSVVDAQGNAYIYGDVQPIDVEISVTGANTASVTATDPDGDGTYTASYTPTGFGADTITVTVDGDPTGDSPFTTTTAPRPVDPAQSSATVMSAAGVPNAGKVGAETTVTISVVNEIGEAYDYPAVRPIDVQVEVSGDNTVAAYSVTDDNNDGTYITTYTPTAAGTDNISVTIDGQPISGSPYSSAVAPLDGDLLVDVVIIGGAPEDGLPVILYQTNSVGELVEAGSGTTDENGIARIASIPFGSYTVHLPKRDFDVEFASTTEPVDFQVGEQTITFSGETLPLPAGVEVWRVRDGGLGNAYQYMVGGRSWNSAQNQVQSDVLLGVQGHLVDILSQGENDFVQSIFLNDENLCPNVSNPKQCKLQGWLGLSDSETEGTFVWTTGEPASFFNWGNNEPNDSKSNYDHAEIGAEGTWSVVNGASSNNEGYFVEWDVTWPITPPSF